MIKLTYFEAFNAVMLTGSMTAAASMLHTSQPNISRSISRLEKATELKLFERLPGNKLNPTADALALFEEVQRSFMGIGRLTETANRIKRSGAGLLRIGAMQSVALSLVPRAVKRFGDLYPEVTIAIHTAHSKVLGQWVREHYCDLAIAAHMDDDDGVDVETLYTAAAACVLPTGHRLAGKKVIEPHDLQGERLISFPRGEPSRVRLERIFRAAHIELQPAIETSYSSITCSLVLQGAGVAVINPFVAREHWTEGLVVRPFAPVSVHNAILMYAKGKPRGRPAQNFVEILKALVVEEQGIIDRMMASA